MFVWEEVNYGLIFLSFKTVPHLHSGKSQKSCLSGLCEVKRLNSNMTNIRSFMLFHATFYASLIFHAECLSAIKQQEKAQGKFYNACR